MTKFVAFYKSEQKGLPFLRKIYPFDILDYCAKSFSYRFLDN